MPQADGTGSGESPKGTSHALVAIVYFLIYQVTDGTWSGAGYTYQAESFPTRVRGTAVGFPGTMLAGGLLIPVVC
ncbi:MAG: hypothetical protein LC781_18675 [Actinobacteria bacterium]|nr:hypothetical protein [Actinomycetota bacterium]